jgi:sialic acid synthase SpsE
LQYIAKTNKPVIISSGMATLEEIKDAVNAIREAGNDQIVTLQCTTSYPLDPKYANLRAMDTIYKECNTLVGYSDHTDQYDISLGAVAMGACVIEKHFTIDKDLPGPDHKASLEPDEFKKMVRGIRNIEMGLGDGIKKPLETEKEIATIARKSIVSAKSISKGVKITEDMLIIKRPGTGILPKELNNIIGKTACQNIPKDTVLSYSMVS